VPYGILHQIGDRSFQQCGVGLHVGHLFRNADDHLGCSWAQAGHGCGDDVGDVDRLDGKGEGTSLEAAHVEQVLDQPAEPV
jgi:hypothetical protein